MEGVKSTSIVFQQLDAIVNEPYACFCNEDINGCHVELYPRVNGDLYICGCGGSDYGKYLTIYYILLLRSSHTVCVCS